jgi:hypothetical protein
MKRFLLKIGFAIVCFSTLLVIGYFVLHLISEKSNACSYSNGKIFVWGDSQMFQGLDVSLLSDKLGEQVLTSAAHGAGVYDFLVNEKNIPAYSVCIVSFSEAVFFRNPLSDNDRTGLDLSCLWDLLYNGCPLDECWRIVTLNNKSIVYSTFRTNHNLHPYADSLIYPEPLQTWHSLFYEEKEWFSWKAKAYEAGLQCLFDKQPQMLLVQFPFDKQVESFAKESINRHLADSIKQKLIEKYNLEYDTIVLKSDSLLMHDLSHMNEIGARLLTVEIADILRADTVNNYFIEVMIQ